MCSCAGRSRLLLLLVAAVVNAAVLPGCCPIESRYFKPELRDFDTPAGVEDVWVDASGGGTLQAWFIPAPSLRDGAGHAPVVLFLHGSRTQIDSLEPQLRPIVERADVSLLLLSYRGYGRSSDCACVTRDSIVRDARAALEYLRERCDVEPDDITVFGYSMGGISALALAAGADPPPARVIVGGTFTTSDAALADVGRGGWAWLIPDRHEPLDNALRLSIPLLIVHGDQDTRVSVRHAREMYVRAQAAHVDAQLYVAPGAGHHDVLQVDPGAMDAIVDFVRVSRGARD